MFDSDCLKMLILNNLASLRSLLEVRLYCGILLSELETSSGKLLPVRTNPAVPMEVLKEIQAWKDAGANEDDWVQRLRVRTVPPGYVPHPWSSKQSEHTHTHTH